METPTMVCSYTDDDKACQGKMCDMNNKGKEKKQTHYEPSVLIQRAELFLHVEIFPCSQ